MELNRHIERSVARHIALTERFYYHPEQRISDLAASLGVDRNTVLSDIAALTSLLGTSIEGQERTRGRVSVRFARNCTLLELIQRVYGESNLLLLCNAYLAHEVDIAAFAGRLGLSISAAYALNRRAVALLTAMGGHRAQVPAHRRRNALSLYRDSHTHRPRVPPARATGASRRREPHHL